MSDISVGGKYGSNLYILDWDGTCIITRHKVSDQLLEEPELLPGVREFFDYASSQGSVVIIVTGRAESARETTLNQIRKLGLWCSYLLCTGSNGRRFLINDAKPSAPDTSTAIGITISRNIGMEQILKDLKEGKL